MAIENRVSYVEYQTKNTDNGIDRDSIHKRVRRSRDYSNTLGRLRRRFFKLTNFYSNIGRNAMLPILLTQEDRFGDTVNAKFHEMILRQDGRKLSFNEFITVYKLYMQVYL